MVLITRCVALTRQTAGLALVAAAASLLAFAGGRSASAQGVVKGKHGGWETRCETPAGAQAEQCALVQSIVDDDRPNLNLVIIALKPADRKTRLLRVIAPLGVLLPTGLSLKVDNEDIGRMNFIRCLANGCVAEVFLDDKLLGKIEGGKQVTFVLFETPEEGVGVPTSLVGFKEGFEALP